VDSTQKHNQILSQISKDFNNTTNNFNNQNISFLGIKNELVCGGMNQPTLRIIKSLNIQEIQLKTQPNHVPNQQGTSTTQLTVSTTQPTTPNNTTNLFSIIKRVWCVGGRINPSL